jgi:hypothetical protein
VVGVKSSIAMMKMDFGSVVISATHGIVVNVKAWQKNQYLRLIYARIV